MNKKILLIITGSIAAYKSLELIRLLRKKTFDVTCVLTDGAKQFVTPMSVASISENNVYDNVFSLKDETEMGHIRLSRDSDLILVAPASADIIGKMANGLADDLASTILLASDKDIFIAPAMNHLMWKNNAVQRNVNLLLGDGARLIEPESGELACGEKGQGRMAEPENIIKVVEDYFNNA
ncbi:MAG: flavoprotein [Rickettsiales bacterium]|nr:flavoprotein [Rickettsiales bacterium]MDG4546118.1 flavoprotein [Rickettsiales bacterium]MDG4547591.1 flavoprotein [Rickettsiales bacterium]